MINVLILVFELCAFYYVLFYLALTYFYSSFRFGHVSASLSKFISAFSCRGKISNYIVFVWLVMNLLDGSWFDAGPKWSTSFKQIPPSNQPHHLVPNLIST